MKMTIKESTKFSIPAKIVNQQSISSNIAEQAYTRDGHSPYINDETKTWFVYDDKLQKYIDTGVISEGDVQVDTELSDISTNPVQNRVITKEVNQKVDEDNIKQLKAIDIDVLWENN